MRILARPMYNFELVAINSDVSTLLLLVLWRECYVLMSMAWKREILETVRVSTSHRTAPISLM